MSPAHRPWSPGLLVLAACTVVFLPAASLLAGCEYLLVNDLRPYQVGMPEAGLVVPVPDYLWNQHVGWPSKLWHNLVDPTSHEAWLYRPFPDAMEWTLSAVFRGNPGAWHVVVFALRAVTTWLTWRLARRLGVSPSGAACAALYAAFFPAFPEAHLTSAETWLAPALVLTVTSVVSLGRGEVGEVPARRLAGACAALGLLTLTKESVAPLSVVLLACLARVLLRRVPLRTACAALALPVLLTANQSVRFALAAGGSYARGHAADDPALGAAAERLRWAVGELTLFPSNLLPVAIAVGALAVVGSAAAWRRARDGVLDAPAATAILGGQAVCLALASVSPYDAIRYLYPSALLLAPVLGLGLDAAAGGRLPGWLSRGAFAGVALGLTTLGGAGLLAQAASLQASSRADRALLERVARRFDEGREIVILADGGITERAHWIECELKTLRLLPDRAERAAGSLRFVPEASAPAPAPAGAVLLRANPGPFAAPGRVVPEAAEVLRFDFTSDVWCARGLAALRRRVGTVQPWFRFPKDAGSARFPGHVWEVVETAR